MSIHVKLPDGSRIIVRGYFATEGYMVEVAVNGARLPYDGMTNVFSNWYHNMGYTRVVDRMLLPVHHNKKERKKIMRTIAHAWEIKLLN